MFKIIGHGAEAKIYLLEGEKNNSTYKFTISKELIGELAENIILSFSNSNIIVKYRYPKKYRHPVIDKKFRKYRTRREYKILNRARKIINVPGTIFVDEEIGLLVIEYIRGTKLSEILESLNYQQIMYELGEAIGRLHKEKIVHFDLTTSNVLLSNNKLYVIDFGLSEISTRIEDYAVDLHLMKEALQSRHWKIFEDAWKAFLEGYKKEFPKSYEVLKQLEKVEKRGRYKTIT